MKGSDIWQLPAGRLKWCEQIFRRSARKQTFGSWGCILVKLTSGTVWPAELSDTKIFGRIYNTEAPTVPEGLPPSLVDVIRRCLHTQPEERSSAAEVLKVL
ncbi:hypothetical protein ABBQ32_003153 [Trebouxia sp. C0010 RCD-2024]